MQATTAGAAAPLRFTTMREVAHITLSGDLRRMPQQAVVISGTSAVGVHLREEHQRDRIVGVERDAVFGEQPGKTARAAPPPARPTGGGRRR